MYRPAIAEDQISPAQNTSQQTLIKINMLDNNNTIRRITACHRSHETENCIISMKRRSPSTVLSDRPTGDGSSGTVYLAKQQADCCIQHERDLQQSSTAVTHRILTATHVTGHQTTVGSINPFGWELNLCILDTISAQEMVI